MKKATAGNWYKFEDNGEVFIGQYMGRQEGFECCVCGKGNNAHTFNIWYNESNYETWGFGNEHFPKIIEDLGTSEAVIVSR